MYRFQKKQLLIFIDNERKMNIWDNLRYTYTQSFWI